MLRAAHAAGPRPDVRVDGHLPRAARAAARGRVGRGVRAARDRRDPARLRAARDRRRLLPRARRVLGGRVPAIPRGGARARAARCASTATSSPSAARSRSRSSSARRRSTTSSRPGPRASRCWPSSRRRRRLPAALRAVPRPADAAGPRARRRRRAGGAGDRLQPRLGAVGVDARGDEPGLHAAAPVLRRGARTAATVAPAAVLGLGARGRPPRTRATPPTSCCSTTRTGGIACYHLGEVPARVF